MRDLRFTVYDGADRIYFSDTECRIPQILGNIGTFLCVRGH